MYLKPSRRAALVVAAGLAVLPIAGHAATAAAVDPSQGTNQLVPFFEESETQADRPSSINGTAQTVSDGGRYVVFSTTDALVSDDVNGLKDVYVRDTVARSTILVSVAENGQGGNGDSWQPTISSSGRRVAFTTAATNLVPDRNGRVLDVVVKDLNEDDLRLASRRADGRQAGRNSFAPVLSGDGNVVVFESLGRLAAKDDDDRRDVYASRQSERTRLMSQGKRNRNFTAPARVGDVSYDGLRVVFGNANTVWLRDVNRFATRTIWREGGSGSAGRPTISGDGRFVAFSTRSTAIATDERGSWSDVFRVHLRTGSTTKVSVRPNGGSPKEDSFSPSLSHSGRYVAFSSYAGGLAPNDAVDYDVFFRDMRTATTYLVSNAFDDGGADSVSGGRQVAIDDSGRAVVYQSYAGNLVQQDTNDVADVFLWKY